MVHHSINFQKITLRKINFEWKILAALERAHKTEQVHTFLFLIY